MEYISKEDISPPIFMLILVVWVSNISIQI